MSWMYDKEETERLEDEALRRRIDKVLTGRKSQPVEAVIRMQSERWSAAWRREVRA